MLVIYTYYLRLTMENFGCFSDLDKVYIYIYDIVLRCADNINIFMIIML